MDIKKGDKIHIWTWRGILEEEVLSAGRKYITTNYGRFYRDSLREVDSRGYAAYIIEDLDKYNQDKHKREIINKLHTTDWLSLSYEDILRVYDIVKEK